jgi:hypothetical protein
VQPTKTRREQDVNFGDRTKLSGASGVKTLAWINVGESEPFTVYAEARLTGPAAVLPHIVPLVTIDWGAGTATMAAEHRIVGRLRVPLVASFIRVEGRLVTDQGQPAPADVLAEVSAFIACGTDGETRHNARAIVQTGDSGVLSVRSERILAVAGYNGSAAPLWMMLFDGPALPAAGAVPRMAAPAPAGGPFRMRPASPREFVGGVVWAASAAPLTLAPAAGAAFFVEAEILP